MKLRNLILSLSFVAASAFGADIDGAWAGNFESPNGAVPIAFTFKADGAKFTGTTMGPDGTDVKITDGKIDGNNITFSETLDFGGMPLTIAFKGVISGADLKLTGDIMGMPIEFALKKGK
ncbi:MAG: hypothetical protein ABI824_06930 [Acidobacteriota bacterium]